MYYYLYVVYRGIVDNHLPSLTSERNGSEIQFDCPTPQQIFNGLGNTNASLRQHAPAGSTPATAGCVLEVMAEHHGTPRRLLGYDVTPGGSRVDRM